MVIEIVCFFIWGLHKSDPKKSVCSNITLRQRVIEKPLLIFTLEVQVARIFTA